MVLNVVVLLYQCLSSKHWKYGEKNVARDNRKCFSLSPCKTTPAGLLLLSFCKGPYWSLRLDMSCVIEIPVLFCGVPVGLWLKYPNIIFAPCTIKEACLLGKNYPVFAFILLSTLFPLPAILHIFFCIKALIRWSRLAECEELPLKNKTARMLHSRRCVILRKTVSSNVKFAI